MYYLTDRNEHMDQRCFNDLTLLLKTIFIDSPTLVEKYANERSLLEPITSLDLPFGYGTHSIGELTVAWAKENGEWDNLVWKVAEGMAEEMLDAFADCWMDGEEEILYLGNYVITHD